MPWEIHRAKVGRQVLYAIYSTIVMDYLTPFLPREQFIREYRRLRMQHYGKPISSKQVAELMKNAYTVDAKAVRTRKGWKLRVSFPVYVFDVKK